MFSLYGLNWAELSSTEQFIFIVFCAILLIIGIIDYFYRKNKEKDK